MTESKERDMSERDEGSLSGNGVTEEERRLGLDEQVCEALAAHQHVDASQVGVAVDAATGDLILFGTVPSEDQRRLAEDCAVSIDGVSVVYNRLMIGGQLDGAGDHRDGTRGDGADPSSTEPSPPD
jgi:hypothetical protein